MTDTDTFLADLRQKMDEVGALSVRSGSALSYEIAADDGLMLTVTRAADDRIARVAVTGTTEAFLLDIDGTYLDAATAYDDESKWAALDDFFECLIAYVESDCYEELGERNGRVVRRVLHLTVPGGDRVITGASGWRGPFERLLGYRTKIVRPHVR